MLWFLLAAGLVIIMAGASLQSSRNSHSDIKTGHPSFESIADVTGIWNRQELDEQFGPRDSQGRYRATPKETGRIAKPAWKRWLDSPAGDWIALGTALAAPLIYRLHSTSAVVLLSGTAAYLFAGYVAAAIVVIRGAREAD